MCIKTLISRASFEWHLFKLVPLSPCELGIAWSSFGSSLCVFPLSHNFLEIFLHKNHENTDLYFLAFPNDRTYLKCLVYGIYILEFAQSALILEAGFRTYVTGFGDVEGFNRVNTLWLSVPIFTAIGTFSRARHAQLTP